MCGCVHHFGSCGNIKEIHMFCAHSSLVRENLYVSALNHMLYILFSKRCILKEGVHVGVGEGKES